MYVNVDHTCEVQFWWVDARACKHTTKKVTLLQMNKIQVMGCNQLKDGRTKCNYAAIKSRHI